ncbi:hypothetical protein NliqN6_3295 [Naganishia liquefaciens]|uniref:Transcription factor IIIC 90kDa subunit N-terminal domain-containing protein n=1 Tax=Naganishia liquefaciens TaxID=104408 RepID=A0A8H3TTM7_9TREE|nr:hypothetical protein NliqN6_3295 [Naganishia liquefaciens]
MSNTRSTSALCAVHTVPGLISHWTKPGQVVTWNMAGQVAIAEGSSITVLTPFTPPPAAFAQLANKSRPPPPATSIVVDEGTEEAPSIPPEFDRIPCWRGRFSVETSRDPKLQAEVSQLLFDLDEANMLFGPKDPGVKALAWSPKGLTPLGGCFLAVLETNLTLTIRSTEKDYIQGAWLDICNLTDETYRLSAGQDVVESDLSNPNPQQRRAKELLFQCMSWSNAPILPSPWGARPHSSLLAIGTRSGSLALWQFNAKRNWTRIWNGVVAEQWLTHLAWSDWATAGSKESSAELAFACTDGSIQTVRVQMVFGQDGHCASIEVSQPTIRIEPNPAAVSGLQYTHGSIVCTRTGLVQVLAPDTAAHHDIRLSKVGDWSSCSPYSPCSGIGSLPDNSILISLYSGEQHVIRIQEDAPVLDTAASERLTGGIRKNIEETDVTMDEALARKAPRMAGFALAPSMIGDRGSTLFAMVMEPANILDFQFPKDNNRKHMLLLGNIADHFLGDAGNGNAAASTVNSTMEYAALQTATATLLPYLPETVSSAAMRRLLKTSLYTKPMQQDPVEDVPITRDEAVAKLKYDWVDSRKAKLLQLANVWKMWNQNATKTPFDPQTAVTTQEAILEPAFAYMAAVLGQDGSDLAIDMDVICRVLHVDETNENATHQVHRQKILGFLPRGTDIAAKTAERTHLGTMLSHLSPHH